MSASIRAIEGVGPQAADVLEGAGFRTVQDLRAFEGRDRELWASIEARRAAADRPFPPAYWKRLFTRCINIVYRVRSAEATPFVPHQYMCPISLDWFHDPVVVASGMSYSRDSIMEHLERSTLDPLTRENLAGKPIYDNVALRHAVEHCRLHHERFSVRM